MLSHAGAKFQNELCKYDFSRRIMLTQGFRKTNVDCCKCWHISVQFLTARSFLLTFLALMNIQWATFHGQSTFDLTSFRRSSWLPIFPWPPSRAMTLLTRICVQMEKFIVHYLSNAATWRLCQRKWTPIS